MRALSAFAKFHSGFESRFLLMPNVLEVHLQNPARSDNPVV
jgi:hypothetical protein